jgi:integrase
MSRKVTGCIQCTADGRWQAIVRLKDGSRMRLAPFPVGTSEAYARERALVAQEKLRDYERTETTAAARRKIEAAAQSAFGTSECAEWVNAWQKTRIGRRKSADKGLSHWQHHIAPILGTKHPRDWQPDDFRRLSAYLDDKVQAAASGKLRDDQGRKKQFSWKSAIYIWGTARRMAKDASGSKYPGIRCRTDNPSLGIEAPDRGSQKAKTFLYPNEFVAVVSFDAIPLHWRRRMTLAVYLGVRAGELDALEWRDLDLDRGIAHVRRAIDRSTSGETKTTKTGDPRRFCIESELMPLLCQMKAEAGGPMASGRIVSHLNATEYSKRLREFLERACVDRDELFARDIGTKPIGWHDLRATCATWMAVRGDSAPQISQVLGHATHQTTMTYIRMAQVIAKDFGTPFPALPECLTRATIGSADPNSPDLRFVSQNLATPRGFEPLLPA